MIMPLGDDNSDRATTPIVNYTLIALNVLVFVLFQGLGSNDKFTYAYSTVPYEIKTGIDVDRPVTLRDRDTHEVIGQINLEPTPFSVYITLLTSMFMHGGFAHLGGNMLYLWIFGDNVEDKLGHNRYLLFYSTVGILASLSQVLATFAFDGNPYIPSLGASGAIAGVLGGYLLLFPKKRVRVLMFSFISEVPAIVAIGLWFLLQVISGAGSVGDQGGGVAYAAHVGGFIAGLALVKLFAMGRNDSGAFAGATG